MLGLQGGFQVISPMLEGSSILLSVLGGLTCSLTMLSRSVSGFLVMTWSFLFITTWPC